MNHEQIPVFPGVERRVFQIRELRADETAEWPIEGYAAVFNSLSEDLGGFREIVLPGAFTRTLQVADVRGLFNHDPNLILGRNKAGTLQLSEDTLGLQFRIKPPDTQYARDLVTSMKRGDVDQCSFQFAAVKDNWRQETDGLLMRQLIDVDLFDVSPVTFPAYPATSVQARQALIGLGVDAGNLFMAIARARAGVGTDADWRAIESTLSTLQVVSPTGDQAGAGGQLENDRRQALLESFRRRLEILRQY